jgi:hypothetical protein
MIGLTYWWGWELAHPVLLTTEATILALGALGAWAAWLMDRPEPAPQALWQAPEPTRMATAAERQQTRTGGA